MVPSPTINQGHPPLGLRDEQLSNTASANCPPPNSAHPPTYDTVPSNSRASPTHLSTGIHSPTGGSSQLDFDVSTSGLVGLEMLKDPEPGQAPAYPKRTLIRAAIESSPEKKLRLKDIYAAIQKRFEYYRTVSDAEDKWKGSIRHNLSNNPHHEFIRTPKPPHMAGKGCFWAINPKPYRRPTKRRRKTQAKKDEPKYDRPVTGYDYQQSRSFVLADEVDNEEDVAKEQEAGPSSRISWRPSPVPNNPPDNWLPDLNIYASSPSHPPSTQFPLNSRPPVALNPLINPPPGYSTQNQNVVFGQPLEEAYSTAIPTGFGQHQYMSHTVHASQAQDPQIPYPVINNPATIFPSNAIFDVPYAGTPSTMTPPGLFVDNFSSQSFGTTLQACIGAQTSGAWLGGLCSASPTAVSLSDTRSPSTPASHMFQSGQEASQYQLSQGRSPIYNPQPFNAFNPPPGQQHLEPGWYPSPGAAGSLPKPTSSFPSPASEAPFGPVALNDSPVVPGQFENSQGTQQASFPLFPHNNIPYSFNSLIQPQTTPTAPSTLPIPTHRSTNQRHRYEPYPSSKGGPSGGGSRHYSQYQ